jgi:hypothetical protein
MANKEVAQDGLMYQTPDHQGIIENSVVVPCFLIQMATVNQFICIVFPFFEIN